MTQSYDFNGIQKLSKSKRKLTLKNEMKMILTVTKRLTETVITPSMSGPRGRTEVEEGISATVKIS